MAKFTAGLPTDILKDVSFLEKNALDIFKGMTKAGAKVAAENMKVGATRAFKGDTAVRINSKLRVTRSYETRKKEITTKAAYYGYLPKKDGRKVKVKGGFYPGVPVPLLCNLVEYGTSSAIMPKQFKKYWDGQKRPFARPAFSDTGGITAAMLKAQKELSGGLLEQ